MTAYALNGDREKCLKAGMDDYISKPVTVDILNDKIEAMLHQGSGNSASPDKEDPRVAKRPIDPRVLGELLKLQDETESDIVGELTTIFLRTPRNGCAPFSARLATTTRKPSNSTPMPLKEAVPSSEHWA